MTLFFWLSASVTKAEVKKEFRGINTAVELAFLRPTYIAEK